MLLLKRDNIYENFCKETQGKKARELSQTQPQNLRQVERIPVSTAFELSLCVSQYFRSYWANFTRNTWQPLLNV